MKINLTSVRVEKSSNDFVRVALKQAIGQYSEYESYFCICRDEWNDWVRDQLLGNTRHYKFYSDGTYALKFHPGGLQVLYSDRNEGSYFTFPATELVSAMDELFSLPAEDRGEINLTDYLPAWDVKYGPNVVLHIEDDVRAKLGLDEKSPMLSEEVGTGLIDRLTNWAGSYSDGNPIHVSICFDSWKTPEGHPSHYYWWISTPKGERIVNGGWIAHNYPQDDGTVSYRYSMHT